jgi:isoquinoline 1-oxidoreductase beta subunit
MSKQETARKRLVSRRNFLIGLGATGAALVVGVAAGRAPFHLFMAEQLASGGGPPSSFTTDPWAWFEITAENRVRLYINKVEMGQGIHTALAQIAAEELEIDWADLEVVQSGTHTGVPDPSGTSASNSVASAYGPLREAAATLREMLRLRAAAALGIAGAALVAEQGSFTARDGDQRLLYSELVAMDGEWEEPAQPVTLKRPPEFKVIGQSQPRTDLPDKIRGRALYGYDMRLPGMLFGAAIHPPTLEARLVSVAAGDASDRPGIVEVVIDEDFAGVVAETRQQAWAGAAALEAVWDEGHLWQQDELEALVQVPEDGGVVIQRQGDAARALEVTTTLEADYRTPLAAHAPLEPPAALADAAGERVTVWAATQAAAIVQADVADALGIDEEQVEVIPTYLGGGFGRKLNIAAAVEAARLSRAAGRPVHVGWNRAEEMQYGFFRPPTHNRLAAQLDGDRLVALHHQVASGDVAFASFPAFLRTIFGSDFAAWRGTRIAYDAVENRMTTSHRLKLPVATGWWRGLGLLANTFALESFMDELAHHAGVDPLTFRLRHLADTTDGRRLAAVLEAAADRAGYGAPSSERGLGIACTLDYGTAVAQVAEVSFDEAAGEIRVHRLTTAIDPGLIINPDGVVAQVQGAVNMGLSATLLEEATVQDGRIAMRNFDTYPLLTIADSPALDVVLMGSGDSPTGVGEPPIGPVAAAVANAVFGVTGMRLRQLPFTAARIRANRS